MPDTKDKDRRTRYARTKPVQMPEITEMQHLLGWMHELGITTQGSHGPAPLTWSEIHAWQQLTGTDIMPDESITLRRLSDAYCGEYYAASDPMRPAPYQPNGNSIDDRVYQMFSAASKKDINGSRNNRPNGKIRRTKKGS